MQLRRSPGIEMIFRDNLPVEKSILIPVHWGKNIFVNQYIERSTFKTAIFKQEEKAKYNPVTESRNVNLRMVTDSEIRKLVPLECCKCKLSLRNECYVRVTNLLKEMCIDQFGDLTPQTWKQRSAQLLFEQRQSALYCFQHRTRWSGNEHWDLLIFCWKGKPPANSPFTCTKLKQFASTYRSTVWWVETVFVGSRGNIVK